MAHSFVDPRHVIITGASSGLGAALARRYAAPGRILSLTGRDLPRLAAVAEECRQQGADCDATSLDVREAGPLADWLRSRDAVRPLDLLIANAGISGGTGGSRRESEAQARAIYATNVEGVMNSVLPAVELMQPRGQGQIAIMSSLAGFRGFPSAPAYCASKAMVRVWGESLRGQLAASGIGVSVICPGFVATPLTAPNTFPMPLLMSAERAAGIIARGLARNRARVAFPFATYAAVRLLAGLPAGWADAFLRRLPEKA